MNKKTFIQETFDKVLQLQENQSLIFTFEDEREIESKRTAFYHEKRKHFTFNPEADSIQISREGLRLILKKTSAKWAKTGVVVNDETGTIKPFSLTPNLETEPKTKEIPESLCLETPKDFSSNFQKFLKTRTSADSRIITSMLNDDLDETAIYEIFNYTPEKEK